MWTDAQAETLKAMLGEGKTMRECALALAVTRNACIGKAHRLGLVSTTPRGKPAGERKPVKKSEPKPRVIAKTAAHLLNDDLPLLSRAARFRAFQPTTVRKSFMDLEWRDCRDLDASGTYCAAKTEPGRSYCPYHARLMYQPPKARKRFDERLAA